MPICPSIGLNSKPQVWLSVDGPVLWEDLSEALWDPFVLARTAATRLGLPSRRFACKRYKLPIDRPAYRDVDLLKGSNGYQNAKACL